MADGRARYADRFGTVEPVFANVCYNRWLARFTLRGQRKVDGQWKLFCLVHNIEKLARHGYAAASERDEHTCSGAPRVATRDSARITTSVKRQACQN